VKLALFDENLDASAIGPVIQQREISPGIDGKDQGNPESGQPQQGKIIERLKSQAGRLLAG
jgi:hypothetical protein